MLAKAEELTNPISKHIVFISHLRVSRTISKMDIADNMNNAAAANPGAMVRTFAQVVAGAGGSVLDRAQRTYAAFLAANPGVTLRAIVEAQGGLLMGLAGGLGAGGGHLLAAVVAVGGGLWGLLGRAGASVAEWKKRRAAEKAAAEEAVAHTAKYKAVAVNAAAVAQAQGPLREKVAAEAKATAKLKAYLHDMGEQLGAALQAIAALRAAIERTDAKVDAIGADNLNVRGRVGVLEQ